MQQHMTYKKAFKCLKNEHASMSMHEDTHQMQSRNHLKPSPGGNASCSEGWRVALWSMSQEGHQLCMAQPGSLRQLIVQQAHALPSSTEITTGP